MKVPALGFDFGKIIRVIHCNQCRAKLEFLQEEATRVDKSHIEITCPVCEQINCIIKSTDDRAISQAQ